MSNEFIIVFIQISFLGRIRISKLDIGRKDLRDILVFRELKSIIIGDGVDLFSIRGELLEKH